MYELIKKIYKLNKWNGINWSFDIVEDGINYQSDCWNDSK